MTVLHFNHRLRKEAGDDAALVGEIADHLGIALRSGEWSDPPAPGEVSEAGARDARFSFFEAALKTDGCRVLFFGHQCDDIAETLLMRLSRGSGRGLAAPRPVQRLAGGRVNLRPLLNLRGEAIRTALRELTIPWLDDASNLEDSFYRNRIRNTVLPAWQNVAPTDIFRGAAAARERLDEDDEALEAVVDRLLPETLQEEPYPVWSLRREPIAIRRRALNRWLGANALRERFTERGFRALLDRSEEGKPFRCSAGDEDFLIYDGRTLYCERRQRGGSCWTGEVALPVGAELHLPGGRILIAMAEKIAAKVRTAVISGEVDPGRQVFLDAEVRECRNLRVRTWNDGDRYVPMGAPGSRKLQDLFTDRRIDRGERRTLPVVCLNDNTIVWCPGLPPAEDLKIGASTNHVVRLTYDGGQAT